MRTLRYGVPRFFFPEALLEEYYTAGYKEGEDPKSVHLPEQAFALNEGMSDFQ